MPTLHPPGSTARASVADSRVDALLSDGWTLADDPAPEDDTDGPPPKAGRGSSRDAWADYATSQGIDVEDGWSRDDIIAAVEGA